MDQPWYFIGFGALFSVFAGFLTWFGLTHEDAGGFLVAGWLIGGLAGLVVLVGIIALAVEVGTRAARRAR